MPENLAGIISELKQIRQEIQANTTRIIRAETTLESFNKTIEGLENYKERVVKLEGSMHYLNTTLDKTNTTLEKLDETVDSIKEVLTIQKGTQTSHEKTKNFLWEAAKWIGIAGIIPMLKALVDQFNK